MHPAADLVASDMEGVPLDYHNLHQVFSTWRGPHSFRPTVPTTYDLLPATFPPKGRLYSLSEPKRQAMEEYVQKSLAAKITRPSSLPASTGFFFMEKKDKSLQPCIDYWGLNDITVKNRYPLPLVCLRAAPGSYVHEAGPPESLSHTSRRGMSGIKRGFIPLCVLLLVPFQCPDKTMC